MGRRSSNGRPTLFDVARRAGVGSTTVSRALHSPGLVSEALRKTIDDAIRELNYVPNLNARALASHRNYVVAVLIPSLMQGIFSDVLRGIYDGVEDSGLRIEINNTRYDPEIEEQQIHEIVRHNPSAVIVSGIDQTSRSRKMLENAKCPVIQIMDLCQDPIHKIIGFSHHDAGKAMASHLVEAGYRRIAFFSGWLDSRSARRFAGYREALEEAGLFHPELAGKADNNDPSAQQGEFATFRSMTPGMGRDLLFGMLDSRPIDAVFCNNDILALGVLFGCAERGIAVPRELGIAGFNDLDYMRAAHPALSSLRIPRWTVGYEAMLAVRRELSGEPVGERIVDLGFQLMARASTDRDSEVHTARASGAPAIQAY